MKKFYIAMAVLATMALTSCEQEQSFDDFTPLGEGDIAFYIPISSTRAEAVQEGTDTGTRIAVGTDDNGQALYFRETIEYLNPKGAVTRGAPAYTENVGKLYSTMGVYTTSNDLGDAIFNVMDETMTDNPAGGKGWRYNHQYDGKYDPWEDETTAADFYLRMPASQNGGSGYTYANGTIQFDYDASNLQNGAGLQDILFGYTSISKKTHDGYLPKGAPVTMYHALTGVKFRVGNDNTGTTKTIIRSVEISGLKDYGRCVITPSGDGTVNWTPGENPKVGSFKLDFKDYKYGDASETGDDNTIDYVEPTEGDAPFGKSWYKGKTGVTGDTKKASEDNLNDEDGSLTFWFIPQTLTEDVVLKVTFCVKTPDTNGAQGGGMITHTINFGEVLEGVEWKAGELRTYTLEPEDVDVEIFDTMSGKSKSTLHVTNTGNVSEYVRMVVIGNWYGWETQADYESYESTGKPEPDILVGYKYSGPTDPQYIADVAAGKNPDVDEMAEPWYRETPEYGQYFDNTFTNGTPANGNKWLRGNTGFYYPDPIGPGTTMDAASEALFKSYIWPEDTPFPTIYIPDPESNIRRPAIGVHLIMEISVQAISNKKPDGSAYADCWAAWTAAIYPDGGGTIGPK